MKTVCIKLQLKTVFRKDLWVIFFFKAKTVSLEARANNIATYSFKRITNAGYSIHAVMSKCRAYKQATLLSQLRKPEVNISHARTVTPPPPDIQTNRPFEQKYA